MAKLLCCCFAPRKTGPCCALISTAGLTVENLPINLCRRKLTAPCNQRAPPSSKPHKPGIFFKSEITAGESKEGCSLHQIHRKHSASYSFSVRTPHGPVEAADDNFCSRAHPNFLFIHSPCHAAAASQQSDINAAQRTS